jgi:hypothetical protein
MKRLFAALLILSAAGSAQAVTEINSCADIELAGNAVVTTDLDCTADQLFVSVTPYGIIDFQGHTIINGRILCTAPNYPDANCNIYGPGTLQGEVGSSGTIRVRGLDMINGRISAARATVQETTITGPDPGNDCAIEVRTNYASSLKIIDTVVTGARCAVYSTHNTTIRGSTFNDSLYDGVEVYWNGFSARLRVSDSEASGNGTFGFAGSRITIKNSKFNDNGEEGLAVLYAHDEDFPASLSVKGCEAIGNGIGISDTLQKSTSIFDCTITGNSLRGVSLASARANLRDSIITGNGQAPECSDPEMRCADVVSEYAPSLDSDTTCDRSLSWYAPTENWGVCAMD